MTFGAKRRISGAFKSNIITMSHIMPNAKAAAGCDLAAKQGAEFEICDPGLGVWVNDVNIIWNEKKQDNGR